MVTRSGFRALPLTVIVGGIATLACAHPVPPPEQEEASFSFDSPESTAGRGISIAIIQPARSDRLKESIGSGTEFDLGVRMRSAIGRSTYEYFTASGFTVSGPYKSVDDMTFPEKKQADLVLTVEYDLVPSAPSASTEPAAGGRTRYSARGNCTMAGGVSFVLWEPLSKQRMWSKTAEVEAQRVDCSQETYDADTYNITLSNSLTGVYEEGFQELMETMVRYFDPEEVKLVKQQSLELRERKVY